MMDSQFLTTPSALHSNAKADNRERVPPSKSDKGARSEQLEEYARPSRVLDILQEPYSEQFYPPMPCILLTAIDAASRELLVAIFADQNVAFELASHKQEFLEKIRHKKYDLLIVDLNTSETGAASVMQLLHTTDNPNRSTAIMAITEVSSEPREEMPDVDVVVEKPLSETKIIDVLQRYVWGEFRFSRALDTAWLAAYYDNNIEFALGTFQLFLDVSYEEFKAIQPVNNQLELKKLRSALHKSKPSFKMVGLSAFYFEIDALEKAIARAVVRYRKAPQLIQNSSNPVRTSIALNRKSGLVYPHINRQLTLLHQALDQRKRLLEHEVKRMQQYLHV